MNEDIFLLVFDVNLHIFYKKSVLHPKETKDPKKNLLVPLVIDQNLIVFVTIKFSCPCLVTQCTYLHKSQIIATEMPPKVCKRQMDNMLVFTTL